MDIHSALKTLHIIGFSIIFVIGSIGNGLICFVLNRNSSSKSNFEVLIHYLAAVNLSASSYIFTGM